GALLGPAAFSSHSQTTPHVLQTLPPLAMTVGELPKAGTVRIAREGPLVAIEDETDDLRRLRQVQRLLEQLARRFVGSDDDEKSVHPFLDDPAIRNGHQRRGVEHDEVVLAARGREELPDA